MTAKQYSINNQGTTNVILNEFTFTTPSGLTHTVDLSGFGGSSAFTGNTFIIPGSLTLSPGQSKLLSIDYTYVSGTTGTKHGNITVSSRSGKIASIETTINVVATPTPAPVPVPAPVPAPTPAPVPIPAPPPGPLGATGLYVTPNSYTVNEGSIITFTVTATGNVPNGYVIYWRLDPDSIATNNDFTGSTGGTIQLNNKSGTFTMTVKNAFPSNTGATAKVSVWVDMYYTSGVTASTLVTLTKAPPVPPPPPPVPRWDISRVIQNGVMAISIYDKTFSVPYGGLQVPYQITGMTQNDLTGISFNSGAVIASDFPLSGTLTVRGPEVGTAHHTALIYIYMKAPYNGRPFTLTIGSGDELSTQSWF